MKQLDGPSAPRQAGGASGVRPPHELAWERAVGGGVRAWDRSSWVRVAGLLLGSFSLACSVQTEDFTAEDGQETTHVVARIEKVSQDGGQLHGTALAGFVRLPSTSDPDRALQQVGLREALPGVGECLERESGDLSRSGLVDGSASTDLDQGELIDAGDVQVVTPAGVHPLAPHALPSAYDLLRGVLYSSRNQEGDSLLTENDYRLRATWNSVPQPLLAEDHEGPELPRNVEVDGQPWEMVDRLADTDILELSWEPSPNDDDVVIELATDHGRLICRFLDAEGYAAVPLLAQDGSRWLQSPQTPARQGQADPAETELVRLSIARQRTTSVTSPSDEQGGPYRLEFNFDFSRSKLLPLDVLESRGERLP